MLTLKRFLIGLSLHLRIGLQYSFAAGPLIRTFCRDPVIPESRAATNSPSLTASPALPNPCYPSQPMTHFGRFAVISCMFIGCA